MTNFEEISKSIQDAKDIIDADECLKRLGIIQNVRLVIEPYMILHHADRTKVMYLVKIIRRGKKTLEARSESLFRAILKADERYRQGGDAP